MPVSRALKVVLWLAPAALLIVLAGCSLRDEPRYNRFSPNDGNPTVMQRAEQHMQAAEVGLDNAERRVENIID